MRPTSDSFHTPHGLYTHDFRRLTNEILHHPIPMPREAIHRRCIASRPLLPPGVPHDSMLWRDEVVQDFGTLTPFFPAGHLSVHQC